MQTRRYQRRTILIVSTIACLVSLSCGVGRAQFGTPAGITVQQPVVSAFNVNTAVAVPDGGTISLGGISNSAHGSARRGVPLTGGPYVNRLFNNRAIGWEQGASQAQVTVKVLVMEELEAQVLAEGARRMAIRNAESRDPNGSAATQKKADFMSRNIGTRRQH